jgi:ABC-type multidrug transport system permease subunit
MKIFRWLKITFDVCSLGVIGLFLGVLLFYNLALSIDKLVYFYSLSLVGVGIGVYLRIRGKNIKSFILLVLDVFSIIGLQYLATRLT